MWSGNHEKSFTFKIAKQQCLFTIKKWPWNTWIKFEWRA